MLLRTKSEQLTTEQTVRERTSAEWYYDFLSKYFAVWLVFMIVSSLIAKITKDVVQ